MKAPGAWRVWLSQEPIGPGATARPMAMGFALLAVLLPALLACGCSTFNRDWRAAVMQPSPPDAITGRWEGAWKSDASGHTGKLRGLVSKVDETHYRANFRATYRHILHFSYAVPLAVDQSDGVWHFSGEEDLGGLAGGVYRYEGQATPTNFFSTYRSQYDHGTFQMGRPRMNSGPLQDFVLAQPRELGVIESRAAPLTPASPQIQDSSHGFRARSNRGGDISLLPWPGFR